VGVAAHPGETAEWATVDCDEGTLTVGPDVYANGAAAITTLRPRGGTLVCHATCTTVDQSTGNANLTYRGGDATTVSCYAGTLRWDCASDITNCHNARAGHLDFDAGNGPLTVTNGYLGKGYRVTETKQRVTVTNGWKLTKCGRDDGTFERGVNYTESHAAI